MDDSDAVSYYKQNGFWIAKGILSRDQVMLARQEMHDIFVQQLRCLGLKLSEKGGQEGLHEDMAALLHNDKERYLASLRLCPRLVRIHELFMATSVRRFVASLGLSMPVFQTAPVFHVISADLRIPGGYYGYGVHQDWPALQSGLDTVTIWIPFVSVDETNYTLDILPGSHLGGLYPGTMQQNAYETDPQCYREQDFVPVRAEPGDALFMSCFMLHRSSLIGGKQMRLACSMRYENGADPSFVAHAYPFVHKRVVQREFLVEDLPTAEQVRSMFRP